MSRTHSKKSTPWTQACTTRNLEHKHSVNINKPSVEPDKTKYTRKVKHKEKIDNEHK